MTSEEIQQKVIDLTPAYGNINVITLQLEDGDTAVGFMKDPSYDVLLYMTDCMVGKEMSRGAEAMVKYCLIPEASDSRIMDRDKYPKIAASFVLQSFKLFSLYTSGIQVKKN